MQASSEFDRHAFVTLDAIRGVAAISVMFHHYAHMYQSGVKLFGMSFIAVDIFFCLSGFVLGYSYSARLAAGMSARKFMIRRLVRLYPFYLIALAIGAGAFAIDIVLQRTSGFDFGNFIVAAGLGLFFLPYLHGGTGPAPYYDFTNTVFPFNDPAWSLFFELFANGIYAAYAWTYRSLLAVIVVSSIGFLIAVWYFKTRIGWGFLNFWGGFPRVTLSFFSGGLIFHIWKDARLPPLRISSLAVLAAVALLLAIPPYKPPAFLVISVFALIPLLILAGVQNEPAQPALPVCRWLGRISYGLYAIHIPIYTAFDVTFAWAGIRMEGSGLLLLAALSAVTSLAAAHLLTGKVDEPLRMAIGRSLGHAVNRTSAVPVGRA